MRATLQPVTTKHADENLKASDYSTITVVFISLYEILLSNTGLSLKTVMYFWQNTDSSVTKF